MQHRHRPLRLAAAAGALALGLAACGGTSSVPQDEVETRISEELTAQVGQEPDAVDCPGDLEAEVGTEMVCELHAGGESIDVTVTVASVEDGTVNFDIKVADEVN